MPLTKKGKLMLETFQNEYGKKKGEEVFYAYINKHPNKTKDWEKK